MKRVGYKVMAFKENCDLIRAGANGNLTYEIEEFREGSVLEMPGNGCYLALDEDYVMDYYSGLAEKEILIKMEFDTDDIITGDINDKEPELSLSKVKILDVQVIEDGEISHKLEQKPVEKKKRERKSKNRY